MINRCLHVFLFALLICPLFTARTYGQPARRGPRGGGPGGSEAVTEPFQGITTHGQLVHGLYRIQETGVSTAPVRRAADAYLASISAEQRQRTLFPVDDREWRLWDNRHRAPRQGVSFKEMNESQRELAIGLLRDSLSAKGLKQTRDIMRLNETIAEMTRRTEEYGEWLYWITIMGTPSDTEPWGWQLDGHHAIINYFVLGDQVVMSPVFMGSEPVRADEGKFKGTVVLQDEQDKGLEFMRSLDEKAQAKATLKTSKTRSDSLAQAYQDNLVLDFAGIQAKELSDAQKRMLLGVVAEFVGNMKDGHARVRMAEVEEHLDDTWFAWIGGTGDESEFYYRIHSPVVLIEFDHQGPIALRDREIPPRNHIHSVVRTPNGNDYGKDILRLHYQQHAHTTHATTPLEDGYRWLFDGKSLAGWIQHGGKAKYHVEDDQIVGTSIADTPNSFLCTKKHFGDFILELEFKVDPLLNSGIQIRSRVFDEQTEIPLGKGKTSNVKADRVHGYQVEIDPSKRAWSGGIYDEARRGWLNDLKENQPARMAFKQNQWNHFRVECRGDSIKTWLNGVPAADLTDSLTHQGLIALQVHGVGDNADKVGKQVRWRHIRIKELD